MAVALDPNDTIAAIASPPGPAERGIVRLSGPAAWRIALSDFIADEVKPPPERPELRAGRIQVDGLRCRLPVSLALWPAPRTYTGQQLVEIHLVGSSPLLGAVLAHCLGRGARLAEPGEFTLRAFLSGRIDLTRAEAVLGVIDAQNPHQLHAALAQLAGGLSAPVIELRDHLLDAVAHLEANLDFTEEPDVDPVGRAELAERLRGYTGQLIAFAAQLDDRERGDHHPRVVLTGAPNAGKSKLFNALVGRDEAIVSPQAGTTRDYLTARCVCDGLTIELVDTAGAEISTDAITHQAQSHRTDQLAIADLIVTCVPCDQTDDLANTLAGDRRHLVVTTKFDLSPPSPPPNRSRADAIRTSALERLGLEELERVIASRLRGQDGSAHLPLGTAARCRGSVLSAEAAIRSAIDTLELGLGEELVAADLRLAMDELGRVVGSVVTDDILDRIFSRFCIGK
jgi:tRNA modification GTPase